MVDHNRCVSEMGNKIENTSDLRRILEQEKLFASISSVEEVKSTKNKLPSLDMTALQSYQDYLNANE